VTAVDASGKVQRQGQVANQGAALRTVPGIGAYSAMVILAEIGEIERFPTKRRWPAMPG
jgi:transposase